MPQRLFDQPGLALPGRHGFKAVHRLLVDELSAELVYDRNYSETTGMLLSPSFRYRSALDRNEAFGL